MNMVLKKSRPLVSKFHRKPELNLTLILPKLSAYDQSLHFIISMVFKLFLQTFLTKYDKPD